MKLPFTMWRAWAGFSHMGRGRGRWYELRMSSPELGDPDAMMPSDRAKEGEGGSGGT